MGAVYGGVETGGTWCVCAVGRAADGLHEREQFPTTTPGETLDRIAGWFESHGDPDAIGIASFGPVDLDPSSPTWGSVTTTPKAGWRDTPVAPVLRDRLGVPVAFDTDTNAAAIAEHRWGAGRGLPSLCYVTVGTGIGGGLVMDGQPVRGLIHPEPGHLRVPHDTERDPFPGICPSHGDCWEGLASGPALRQRWGADPESLPGDHPAWELEAEYIALGLLAIVSVASPHRIVCGGGVMDHGPLLDSVRTHLRDLVAGYLASPLLGERVDEYVVRPELGDDAGVLGALALAESALTSEKQQPGGAPS
jgi:fructokinase